MNKTILLIEDEIFIRELYERILIQSGYRVITASNGEEGLEKTNHKIDLILLDIMLPKKNGLEVLKVLKNSSSTDRIPVVLISNLGQETIIKEAFEIGAVGYLMKMRVSPYDIIKTVDTFIKNPSYKMDFTQINFD